MRFKGYLFIFAAAVLWGLIGPVARFALDSGTSAMEIGFFRALIAWVFFASAAFFRRKTRMMKKDLPLVLIFGLVGISVFYSSNLIAVEKGGAAFAAVLLYTAPAWVAILSPIFFKEKITLNKSIAVVLTMTGIAAICFQGNAAGKGTLNFNTTAIIAGVISGLSYSMYYLVGKYFSSRYDACTLFLYILPVGAVGLLPFISFSHKTAEAWAALIFLGFFCSYLANSFYYAGLHYLDPTKAVLTASLEPVVAAFFAWLIWDELFSLTGVLGALMILSGVITTIYDNKKTSSFIDD